MPTYQNPLIEDDPADTIYNARSVLAAIQEYYCAKDLPNREQSEMVYTGLFWMLKIADEALAYEAERVSNTSPSGIRLNG